MSWGAIFDWDGVIIDSSAHHEESWERLAAEIAKPLPPGHFKRGFGMKNEFIIPQLLAWTEDKAEIERLSLRKEALYRNVVQERGLVPLPGVEAWLRELSAAKVPCAVGSSTHRLNIETALEMIHLRQYFSHIVSSEDVTNGKPAPDVFLRAAEKISLPPQRCVVFEDAHVGIEAARRAGMHVVALATTNPLSELTEADVAVERLDQLDLRQLAAWFA
ncbi:MAG: beta-phosphoglucomutase [Chthoniobacter sp.]|nr:beta-phosphoglucomutase [Chthoniobacter sp.]